MARRKGRAPRQGDIFAIPSAQPGFTGVGQVVGKYLSSIYLAVFDDLLPDDELTGERAQDIAAHSELVFLALTFDGKLYNGDWRVVSNAPVERSIPFPKYIETTPEGTKVVDHEGNVLGFASDKAEAELEYRKMVAPIRLEKAFQARLGELPWDEDYDELLISR